MFSGGIEREDWLEIGQGHYSSGSSVNVEQMTHPLTL